MDFAFVAQTFNTLRIVPPSELILLEAPALASTSAHVPPYPPDVPALIVMIDSRAVAMHLKKVLLTAYPGDHMVYAIVDGMVKEERVGELTGEAFGGDA